MKRKMHQKKDIESHKDKIDENDTKEDWSVKKSEMIQGMSSNGIRRVIFPIVLVC